MSSEKNICCLGTNHYGERIWLRDFSWDCNWYWGGGYVGNRNTHYHFESFYEMPDGQKTNLFDGFKAHFKSTNITDEDLWRLCDLMKQFYSYKSSAECFRYGGHYSSVGRTEAEIDTDMADKINKHIENVIIPEVRGLMGKYK